MPTTLGSFGVPLDLKIRQGGTFGPYRFHLRTPVEPATDPVTYLPFSLVGCVIRAQLRKAFNKPKILDFTVTIIDAAGGVFDLSVPELLTYTLQCDNDPESLKSRYAWDLEILMPDGVTVRPMYFGDVRVFREITKAVG